MDEIRNELLLILQAEKETNQEDHKLKIEWLLERFQYQIEEELKEVKYKEEKLNNNLKVLEYVKKELNIK
jgi:hypothetical protein